MSNDRELLELAAKAAGIKGAWQSGPFLGIVGQAIGDIDVPWNPLRNDGQALCLAVKLGLDVCIDSRQENEPRTLVIGFRYDHGAETIDTLENHGDPYAATRRAIVRAAAEIGKEMK